MTEVPPVVAGMSPDIGEAVWKSIVRFGSNVVVPGTGKLPLDDAKG